MHQSALPKERENEHPARLAAIKAAVALAVALAVAEIARDEGFGWSTSGACSTAWE